MEDYNNYFSNYVSENQSKNGIKFDTEDIYSAFRKQASLERETNCNSTIQKENIQTSENLLSGRMSCFESFKESKKSLYENSSFVKMTDYSQERATGKKNTKNKDKSSNKKSPVLKLNLSICEKKNNILTSQSDPELLASERIREIVETVRRERSMLLQKKEEKAKEKETRRKLFIGEDLRNSKFDSKNDSPSSRNTYEDEDIDKENVDVNRNSSNKKKSKIQRTVFGERSQLNPSTIQVMKLKVFQQEITSKTQQLQNYNTLETYSHFSESKIDTPIIDSDEKREINTSSNPELLFIPMENGENEGRNISYNSNKDPMKFYISGEFLTPIKDQSLHSKSNKSFLRYTSFGKDSDDFFIKNSDFDKKGELKLEPQKNITEINYRTDETMEFNFRKKKEFSYNEAQETERDYTNKFLRNKKEENIVIDLGEEQSLMTRDSFKKGMEINCSSLYKISFLSFMKQLMRMNNIFLNFELEIAVQHYTENIDFKERLMKFFYSKEIMNSVVNKSSLDWRYCEEYWLKNFASNLKIDRLSNFKGSTERRLQVYSWMTQIDQNKCKTQFTMLNNRTRKLIITTKNLPLNAKKINAFFINNKNIRATLRDNNNSESQRPCLFFLNGQSKHLHYYDVLKRKHANVFTPDFHSENNSRKSLNNEPINSLIENYKIYKNHCILTSNKTFVLIKLTNFEEEIQFTSESKILTAFFVDEKRLMVIPEFGKKVEFYDINNREINSLIISKKIPRSKK